MSWGTSKYFKAGLHRCQKTKDNASACGGSCTRGTQYLLRVLELEVEMLVCLVVSSPAHQRHRVAEHLHQELSVAPRRHALADCLQNERQRTTDQLSSNCTICSKMSSMLSKKGDLPAREHWKGCVVPSLTESLQNVTGLMLNLFKLIHRRISSAKTLRWRQQVQYALLFAHTSIPSVGHPCQKTCRTYISQPQIPVKTMFPSTTGSMEGTLDRTFRRKTEPSRHHALSPIKGLSNCNSFRNCKFRSSTTVSHQYYGSRNDPQKKRFEHKRFRSRASPRGNYDQLRRSTAYTTPTATDPRTRKTALPCTHLCGRLGLGEDAAGR